MALNRNTNPSPRQERQAIFLGATEPRAARPKEFPAARVISRPEAGWRCQRVGLQRPTGFCDRICIGMTARSGAGPAWSSALLPSPGTSRRRVGALTVRWIGLMVMPTGRVKFFNTDRGFGFIAPDGGGSDVFVHVSDVEAAGMKTLVEGQLVAYEVGTGRGGRSKAVNVRLLNPKR